MDMPLDISSLPFLTGGDTLLESPLFRMDMPLDISSLPFLTDGDTLFRAPLNDITPEPSPQMPHTPVAAPGFRYLPNNDVGPLEQPVGGREVQVIHRTTAGPSVSHQAAIPLDEPLPGRKERGGRRRQACAPCNANRVKVITTLSNHTLC
jgi:hypothetical protein